MSKAPKNSLSKKHWFGYMFGDRGGCLTFALTAGCPVTTTAPGIPLTNKAVGE